MNDVMVSSYQTGGSSDASSIPMDQFTLNFVKIKYEYMRQKPAGTLEGAVSAGYNRDTNKASSRQRLPCATTCLHALPIRGRGGRRQMAVRSARLEYPSVPKP